MPSICKRPASHHRQSALSARVVCFSICFFYVGSLSPASGTADGGITTDPALILNTMKHHCMHPFKRFKRHQNGLISFCWYFEPSQAVNRIFLYTRARRCPLCLLHKHYWVIFLSFSVAFSHTQQSLSFLMSAVRKETFVHKLQMNGKNRNLQK